MSTLKFENAMKEAYAELSTARNDYEEFMTPIQPRIDEFHQKIRSAREAAGVKLLEVLKQVTHEDLCEPLTAMLVSEMMWNEGMGLSGGDEHLHMLFEDTYVMLNTEAYGETRNNSTPVLTFQVGIPKDKDEAVLKRTAELLAPVYEAFAEISEHARISVFDDGLSAYDTYAIVKEDGVWELRGRYSTQCSHEELVEVLRKTPTYM